MKKILLELSLFCFCATLMAFGDSNVVTRRFGIFVGSNNGGLDRAALRYAVSDARAVSRVFIEMGGIDAVDSVFLIEPNLKELNRRIGGLHERVIEAKQTHKRTEIVFYYSGHSDEEGLLINRERYWYRELREQIKNIPSDMRVVILDSCSSGAFTRAKGGVKTQPFLFDDSMATEGYAFLSSSSATEASQESDAIGGSYFTHSLLAGLRGAADTIGDGRVTLNEVYRYAYTETLARTEISRYGTQHPSYDMQINGTGDMVLTDIKETSAGLIIGEAVAGRLSIRDSSDYLVAEITKTAGKSMELGLEPGLYRITLQQGNVFSRAEISLVRDQRTRINPADFRTVVAPPSTARGAPADATEAVPVKPVNVQLLPGVGLIGFDRRAFNFVFLGILGGIGYNLKGFGLAGIGLSNTGFVRGVQLSGLYNTVRQDMDGFEMALIFNMVLENTRGMQTAGIVNITGGNMDGMQMGGIFNWTQKDNRGSQLGGLVNVTGGSFRGAQLGGLVNVTGGSGEWFQGAVIANITGGNMDGMQMGGIFNWAQEDNRGSQLGGLVNVTGGSFRGLQMGLVNVTGGSFRGLQMGLVNYHGEGDDKSVGVGLINISKSENLVPIGLINIIKNGMFHPAVWYDDLQFVNLSLKSGSKNIYSIFGLGIQDLRFNSDSEFITRAGVGVEIPLGKTFIDLDLTAGNIYGRFWKSNSLLAQARVSAGFKLFKHLGAFAGVSYDYSLSWTSSSPRPGRDFGFSALSWGNDRHTHKIGFFGGIQF
ncbi:MAG: caspase family protein [Spirochaetaceae bacterium]|jgi:hypothetical protein|nr:caspase family protein [Spirochaetaceae bacterium]